MRLFVHGKVTQPCWIVLLEDLLPKSNKRKGNTILQVILQKWLINSYERRVVILITRYTSNYIHPCLFLKTSLIIIFFQVITFYKKK